MEEMEGATGFLVLRTLRASLCSMVSMADSAGAQLRHICRGGARSPERRGGLPPRERTIPAADPGVLCATV